MIKKHLSLRWRRDAGNGRVKRVHRRVLLPPLRSNVGRAIGPLRIYILLQRAFVVLIRYRLRMF